MKYGGRTTLRRGGEFSEIVSVNQFRQDFIRIISRDPINVNQLIRLFRNVRLPIMRSELINVRIPVVVDNDNKYVPTVDKNEATDFVPLLCIVFQRVRDMDSLRQIIRAYTRHNGDLNLKNTSGEVAAIDVAFAENNIELVKYLMTREVVVPDYIREQVTITPVQKKDMLPMPTKTHRKKTVKKTPPVSPPRPPSKSPKKSPNKSPNKTVKTPPTPPQKKTLVYTDIPETEYNPNEIPEFWHLLFPKDSLIKLRDSLTQTITEDIKIKPENERMSQMWGICKRVQDIIPRFTVPQDVPKPFYDERERVLKAPSPFEFAKYNIILCATFLIYGIIANKMHNQDYNIIFKGGKGVQLALSKNQQVPPEFVYESEDIDILLTPKPGVTYHPQNAESLATHIAYLVKWLLNDIFSGQISVLLPNDKRARTKTIVKLSYFMAGFKQFSDISFDELPEREKPFFEGTSMIKPKTKKIEGLDENAAFIFQPVDKIVDEKIYFICKYLHLMKTETQQSVREEYTRVITKFKRTILEIARATVPDTVDEYIRSRFAGLSQIELQLDEFMKFMQH
jgi:hypothetical protein